MGLKDIVTKDYTKETDVFADAFNQYIYKGKQVIKPENLKPLDTNITGIPYGADGAGVPVQRFRDVLKSVTAMEDNNAYSKDKAKLNEMVQKDERFRNVDRGAATVISTVTGAEIEVDEKEKKVDMCQALREMMEDATNEGMEKGMQQGIQDERTATAHRMLQKGRFSYEEIAELTSLTVDDVQSLALGVG